MSFLGRLGNDITHLFGLGQPQQPQQAPRPAPIRTPAPGMRPQQQVARTAPMPPQAPAAPHMNPFQRFGNTLHNDVVAPIQRDIVHPIQQAPRAFDQAAVRSPLGRGAQAATLGIAQAGVEGAQGIAGLGDALNHRLGNYQGQSPVSRGLTNIAKNIDVTAKAEHSNPLLYHGSQVGANVLGGFIGGAASDAVKAGAAFPKLGAAINIANKLNPEAKIANAIAGKTAGLAEKGLPGRIAANSIRNIASPKYQAGNAAFTALQSGQQIAQGRKVTPANVATNLAIGAVGLPVAGAVGKEAAAPVVKGAQTSLQIAKNLGLKPPTSLNDSELSSARKILSAREGLTDSSGLTVQDTHNFHNAQIKLGAKPGTPDGMNAISNALDAHHAFNQQVQQRVQSLNAVKQGALKFAQDHPIGMTSGAVDESGNKLGLDGKPLNVPQHIDAYHSMYGDALHHMDASAPGGNKFKAEANGSPVMSGKSPFFRQFQAENGKPPTKADYKNEAIRQLQSGKADPYAQEEYNALRQQHTASQATPGAKTAPKAPVSQPAASSAGTKSSPKAPNKILPNGNKESRFANTTVQNSEKITPLTKQLVQANHVEYTPETIKAGQAQAAKFAKDKNAAAQIQQTLNSPNGHISFQDALNTHAIVDKLQSTGKVEDSRLAADMLSQLSEHHSAAGQLNAAAAAMAKRSPQGIVAGARKLIENGGKKGSKQAISDGLQAKLDGHLNAIKAAEKQVSDAEKAHETAVKQATTARDNGTYKVGQLDKTYKDLQAADGARMQAREDLQKTVQQNIHHSAGSKAFALWRTGLLTGPRTVTKVAVSHTGMGILEQAKQAPAAALDAGISASSRLAGKGGMRSTAFAPQRGLGGLGRGAKAMGHLLKTGHDTPGTGGMQGTMAGSLTHTNPQFKGAVGKILNPYMEKTGQIHASIPKPFYTYAKENSMYKQAIANAKNLDLKGDARAAYIDHFVKSAPQAATEEATRDGQFAAFQQNSASGNVAKALQRVPGGKLIMPFAHIASTILADAAHYSPAAVGVAAHDVIKSLRSGEGWTPRIQKQFVEELGRGITGTSIGVIGYELAKHGLITGGYPTDPSERKLWVAQGKQANAIKIGNHWRSTATLEPAGTLLAAGQSAYEAGQTNGKGKSQTGPAITGALQDMTSQSYLSGLTGLSDAIAHPTQYGAKFVKQEAGSVVPIAVSTTASATDPLQRNTSGVVDSFKSKLPGLRETLTPSQDMYGQNLHRQGGVLTGLLDPTRPTAAVNDPTTNELQRLQTSTGGTSTPSTVKSINATDQNGKKITVSLNTGQQHSYNAIAGPQVKQAYQKILSNPNYNQLTDANKVSALNSAKDNAQAVPKANAAKAVNPNVTVNLTNSQANGVQNDYVQNKLNEQSGGTAGTPINSKLDATSRTTLNKYNGMNATQRNKAAYSQNGFDYQYAQAKYNNDKANGTLSKAANIQALAALNKDKIGADYSKDVRDLYDVNKSDLATYLSTSEPGVDKQKIASDLLAYDKALHDAGVTSSLKYKNGIASSGSGGSGSRSSGGRTASIGKAPAINYSGTSKLTNASLAAIRKSNGTRVRGGKVALKGMKSRLPSAPKIARSKRTSGVIV